MVPQSVLFATTVRFYLGFYPSLDFIHYLNRIMSMQSENRHKYFTKSTFDVAINVIPFENVFHFMVLHYI